MMIDFFFFSPQTYSNNGENVRMCICTKCCIDAYDVQDDKQFIITRQSVTRPIALHLLHRVIDQGRSERLTDRSHCPVLPSVRNPPIFTLLLVLTLKLSSIPGLEDVTVDGVDQRPSAQTNGPAVGSSTPAVSTAPSPPSEVDQTQPQTRTLGQIYIENAPAY